MNVFFFVLDPNSVHNEDPNENNSVSCLRFLPHPITCPQVRYNTGHLMPYQCSVVVNFTLFSSLV